MMSETDSFLGAGFGARDLADWQALVAGELDEAARDRLVTRTEDGIGIQPLYADGAFLQRPARASRKVARLSSPPAAPAGQLHSAIDAELASGSTGVLLELSTSGHTGGLAIDSSDWAELFGALEQEGTLHLRATAHAVAHARAWLECGMGGRSGCDLGLDPYADATRSGDFAGLADALGAAARVGAEALLHESQPCAFVLDAQPYTGAGASTGQAVGCLLAGLVQTLRALEGANVDPARGLATIGLCMRVDPRIFEQVAALRAVRLLHARVAEVCGVEAVPPLHLIALPDTRVLSRRDPWVNMLRQTATCFAGLVGGADAVGAVPFDVKLSQSSALGRRVARNTPVILDEESHLARVEDPAAGSWFLDSLTRDVAEAGWNFFQHIEDRGGLVSVLGSGWLLGELQSSHALRQERLARRMQPRTGVSEYARVDEQLPAPVLPLATKQGPGWPRHGLDDAFESLRSAADRHAVSHPRPRVFLARIGAPSGYAARETWLRNLVAAAGIESVVADPQEDLSAAFVASGAATAILTTDDATLLEQGAAVTESLARFGSVWAAGKPVESLRVAGVSRFVHIGIDVIEALEALLVEQGVQG